MLDTTLLVTRGARQLAYLIGATISIATIHGAGRAVYLTSDGYVGVQLDGEGRIDEYPLGQCSPVAVQEAA